MPQQRAKARAKGWTKRKRNGDGATTAVHWYDRRRDGRSGIPAHVPAKWTPFADASFGIMLKGTVRGTSRP
jgi:hypothetical protein